MVGARLTAVARRVLRHDSFAFIAAPAIADLQFEAPGAPRLRRACHALAVAVTIARVACTDVAADLGLVPGVARNPWPPAGTFARVLATCAGYYGCLLWFLVGLATGDTGVGILLRAGSDEGMALVVVDAAAALVTATVCCLPRRVDAPDELP